MINLALTDQFLDFHTATCISPFTTFTYMHFTLFLFVVCYSEHIDSGIFENLIWRGSILLLIYGKHTYF